ncbi:MAG TPA: thioredoxin-dependent thiol peroxidase [Chthonomonadaceae bacterium]|nr:thioredoxin-dependent thiol peroxidase [Chthonomonadaceae bacterium]
MLNVGDIAPDFELQNQQGETVRLSALRGKTVVLYFYPKADTPGCTKESCAFRDARTQFDAADAVILGISPDTVSSQLAFAEKYGLPFSLLADPDHQVADAYGVWGEKTNYGKTYMGIIRSTFVIDPEGRLSHIFRNVKVDGHSDAVLTAVRERAAK